MSESSVETDGRALRFRQTTFARRARPVQALPWRQVCNLPFSPGKLQTCRHGLDADCRCRFFRPADMDKVTVFARLKGGREGASTLTKRTTHISRVFPSL